MSDTTLFFTSSKTFLKDVAKLPNPKIGCTTAGAIDKKLTDGLVSTILESRDFNIDFVKIKNTTTPLLYAKEIYEKATKLSRSNKTLVCLVLNDGLSGTEETIQNTLLCSLPKNTIIIGASSGDDLDFKETYCCVDDDVFKGAVVVLIGTNLSTYLHKENLYRATDKLAVVTSTNARTIKTIDNKPATTRYAELLNTNVNTLPSLFPIHPLGVKYNNDIYICSPQQKNSDGSIDMYLEVTPGSIIYLLEPTDCVAEMNKTVSTILSKGTPILTLTSNCILRRLMFEKDNLVSTSNNCLRSINAFGFTSYGEQMGGQHINQTMVTLSFYR